MLTTRSESLSWLSPVAQATQIALKQRVENFSSSDRFSTLIHSIKNYPKNWTLSIIFPITASALGYFSTGSRWQNNSRILLSLASSIYIVGLSSRLLFYYFCTKRKQPAQIDEKILATCLKNLQLCLSQTLVNAKNMEFHCDNNTIAVVAVDLEALKKNLVLSQVLNEDEDEDRCVLKVFKKLNFDSCCPLDCQELDHETSPSSPHYNLFKAEIKRQIISLQQTVDALLQLVYQLNESSSCLFPSQSLDCNYLTGKENEKMKKRKINTLQNRLDSMEQWRTDIEIGLDYIDCSYEIKKSLISKFGAICEAANYAWKHHFDTPLVGSNENLSPEMLHKAIAEFHETCRNFYLIYLNLKIKTIPSSFQCFKKCVERLLKQKRILMTQAKSIPHLSKQLKDAEQVYLSQFSSLVA